MKCLICPVCSNKFKAYGTKRKYCSRACMASYYRTSLKGANNPNYKHGPKYCEVCKSELCRNTKGIYCRKCVSTGTRNPFFGKKHNDKTKKLMSQNHYDCRGSNAGMYGRHHTKRVIKILSKKRKMWWKSLTTEQQKEVKDKLLLACCNQLHAKGQTKPEARVASYLDIIGVQYSYNLFIYNKFYVDFYLEDGSIIEVFGDYWHANPHVYTELSDQQERQTKKDKSRLAYLRHCGHRVLVIWEEDINKNDFSTIDEFVKQNVQV